MVESERGDGGGATKSNVRLGILMACAAGVLYGFQFVPLTIWNKKISDSGRIFDHPKPSDTLQALRFFFSQFCGVFLTSLLGFVAYCVKTGNRPRLVPPEAVLPSICSGILWAIGCAGP